MIRSLSQWKMMGAGGRVPRHTKDEWAKGNEYAVPLNKRTFSGVNVYIMQIFLVKGFVKHWSFEIILWDDRNKFN